MIAKPTPTSPHQRMTSNVLAVILRVAGPVITDVRPHALGTPERQVTARIGDVLIYLTDPGAVARIRQRWDAVQYQAKRLPEEVSQTWLSPNPDSYPMGVTVRVTGAVEITAKWVPGSREHGIPPHLRFRADRLIWQICDLQAWRTIGDAWFDAQRYLDQ